MFRSIRESAAGSSFWRMPLIWLNWVVAYLLVLPLVAFTLMEKSWACRCRPPAQRAQAALVEGAGTWSWGTLPLKRTITSTPPTNCRCRAHAR